MPNSRCYYINTSCDQQAYLNMSQILKIVQILVAILLTISILLQARGTGLSSAFGGEGNFYRTKRGLEKIIFRATIVLAILFLALALVNFLI